ncbi:MAG TPA: ATP-binding protein [Stellaceae bacterium]|nr:ATP-binding protein [Stellaceae bacterium]
MTERAGTGAAAARPSVVPNPIRSVRLAGRLLILAVIVLGAWMLNQSYETELAEASQSLGNQAAILGENVEQLVSATDIFLATASEQMAFDAGGRLTNLDDMQSLLREWSRRLPLPAAFVFGSADGRRLLDTRLERVPDGSDLSSRPGFLWGRADRSLRLGILGPARVAPSEAPETIVFVRRVESGDHRFLGVIAEIVNARDLAAYFAQIKPGAAEAVALLHVSEDGAEATPLARYPYDEGFLRGPPLRQFDPLVHWLAKTPSYEIAKTRTTADRAYRLVGFYRIARYALAVSVARDWKDVLAPWYGRAWPIGASMALVIAFILAVMSALGRQVRTRIEVERRAAAALAERRAAELEAQASKLDALARLSGGVAHEFNNLLQPIKTLSDLGRHRLAAQPEAPPDRLKEYFERIHDAATMASDIADHFLVFCGADKRSSHRHSIGTQVHAATEHLRFLVPDWVDLECEAPLGIEARFDDLGLAQVMANLFKNAVEALEAGPQAGRKPRIVVAVSRSDSGDAILRVADNGPGMSEAVRARIFEPFFTTKAPSGGTGLGLAVVYGIVNAWGGRIDVESRPGGGASFTITLPAAEPIAAAREDFKNLRQLPAA